MLDSQGPQRVCGTLKNRVNNLEAEDTVVSLIELENGAIGTFEATTAARPQDIEASLSVTGVKGYATIGGIALNKVLDWNICGGNSLENIADHSEEVETGYGYSHYRLINELVTCIAEKKDYSPNSIPSTIDTLKTVHSIYRSAENNHWISIKDNKQSKKLGLNNGNRE